MTAMVDTSGTQRYAWRRFAVLASAVNNVSRAAAVQKERAAFHTLTGSAHRGKGFPA